MKRGIVCEIILSAIIAGALYTGCLDPAQAQNVTVIGPITTGHIPIFNSPTVIKDSGQSPASITTLVPGTTPISPSTSGGVLFDNAGVLGDSTTLPSGLSFPSLALGNGATVVSGQYAVIGNAAGNINIPTADVSPSNPHMVEIVNDNLFAQSFRMSTYGTSPAIGGQNDLHFYRAGGTAASPTATQNGMLFVSVGLRGNDGQAGAAGNTLSAGAFAGYANQNFNSTSHGAGWYFEGTPNGSITRTRIIDLWGSGSISIGGGADPGVVGAINATTLALNGCSIGANKLCVTGAVAISNTLTSGNHIITTTSTGALVVGPNGLTNPVLNVDASTASQVAGLSITGAATGGTVAIATTDSGSNNNLTINAKGTGNITLGNVSSGTVIITPTVRTAGNLTFSTSGNGIVGTTTNDNANAGNVGEYIQSQATNATATVTFSNGSPNITWTAHGLTQIKNGCSALTFQTTGALPTNFSAGVGTAATTFYLTVVDANTLKASSSVANCLAGTFVTAGSAGSGTQTALNAIPLATATPLDIGGVSLTAGDFDVWNFCTLVPATTTNVSQYISNVTQTSNTLDTTTLGALNAITEAAGVPGNIQTNVTAGPVRVPLASTTTLFGDCRGVFTVAGMTGYGGIRARRVR